MSASLHALLAGAVDYAGLFPPAGLPLEQAVGDYARYRREPEAWMLGRFVCPAARLAELAPFHDELFRGDEPFLFSALGRGGAGAEAVLRGPAARRGLADRRGRDPGGPRRGRGRRRGGAADALPAGGAQV